MRRLHPTCSIHPTAVVERSTLGDRVRIDGGTWVSHSQIGARSYIAEGASVAHAEIGRFCSVAPRSYVGLPQHPSRVFVSTHPVFYQHIPDRFLDFTDRNYLEGFVPTTLGNDVWIGAGAMIRGGLKIGDGAIIGAGAVVTKGVPPYAIFAGVPARMVRYRFEPAEIEFLLAFRWWDREEAWLKENFHAFHDIDELKRRFPITN